MRSHAVASQPSFLSSVHLIPQKHNMSEIIYVIAVVKPLPGKTEEVRLS